MFENLTERFNNIIKSLSGQRYLTEENILQAVEEIKVALLNADVSLNVIKAFTEEVKQKALGKEVTANLSPSEALIKVVYDELVAILGSTQTSLNFKTQAPAIFLMAGLQGSGKTTTAAKLAHYLKEVEHKKVMLVSVDVYRPAAIEQLALLAKQLDVVFYSADSQTQPLLIAQQAINLAKKQFIDIVIVDTAGRLHVDETMMSEMKILHEALHPIETLFVVDSMAGQDAVNVAKIFHEWLPLTGVILTKTEGDARGGAALSVKYVIGQPIKFIGTGEKIDAFEVFYPDRIASRILGMGDILTLIEEAKRKTDKKASEKLVKKIQKGSGFDLDDFKQQLLQMSNMGGMANMLSKLPGMTQTIEQKATQLLNDNSIKKHIAIINSMTKKERQYPKNITGSQKKRIVLGSGTTLQDLNRLLKQFEQIQKVMKKLGKPGSMKNMIRNISSQFKGWKGLLPDKH